VPAGGVSYAPPQLLVAPRTLPVREAGRARAPIGERRARQSLVHDPALFGGLVMLTQSAIKTSLAWSTVAQMGFMMLQCGLALFPLALLHIVAHSLYKAHAFLSCGWAVEQVAATRRPGPVAVASIRVVGQAFALALDLPAVTRLQQLKTGALIEFAVEAACVMARLPAEGRTPYRGYARDLGLAFPIARDQNRTGNKTGRLRISST